MTTQFVAHKLSWFSTDHVGVLLPKIKKIPKNTNGRLAIPAPAGLLVAFIVNNSEKYRSDPGPLRYCGAQGSLPPYRVPPRPVNSKGPGQCLSRVTGSRFTADVVKVVPSHWTQFGADPCWQAIRTDPPGQYRSSITFEPSQFAVYVVSISSFIVLFFKFSLSHLFLSAVFCRFFKAMRILH